MPLFHIMDVTSLNSIFSSCFVFLKDEKKIDYIWILEMNKSLFDNRMIPLILVIDRKLAIIFVI